MEYAYLVAEGQHDIEFIGRFLRLRGFIRINKGHDVQSFWQPLIPDPPRKADDLYRRTPIPAFFDSGTHSVAIGEAEGVSNIVTHTADSLAQLGAHGSELAAIGWFFDADFENEPRETFRTLMTEVAKAMPHMSLPAEPGTVSEASPRTGAFVFPDNQRSGTMENLLLECAESVYAPLAREARSFVEAVGTLPSEILADDIREFRKPAGRKKTEVACVANVLKPGKSVQVSIHDNNWICPDSARLPSVARLDQFLIRLLALP